MGLILLQKPQKATAMKTIARAALTTCILMIALYVNAGLPVAVHHQVSVSMPKERPFNIQNVYVVVTDDHNRPVASPQLLRIGLGTYHFFEPATTRGTRIAQLIYMDGTSAAMFNLAAPDVQTGKFSAGFTYLYHLYVKPPTRITGGD
jgi:hypothetical protein